MHQPSTFSVAGQSKHECPPTDAALPVPGIARIRSRLAATFLLIAVAFGCAQRDDSPQRITKEPPKCRILRGGIAVRPASTNLPPGDSGMQMTFIRLDGDSVGKRITPVLMSTEPGTFELIGQDARPIPAGRYRVALRIGPEGRADELNGKFGPENSPIEVEIKEGQDLTIELTTYS